MYSLKKLTGAWALAFVAVIAAQAKTVDNDVTAADYPRSAVYSMLLNSSTQNDYYEQEAERAESNKGLLVSMAATLTGSGDAQPSAIFALPAQIFPSLVLPEQFADINLPERIINYETWREGISAEEAALMNPKTLGQKAGTMAKSAASTAAHGISKGTKALKGITRKAASAAVNSAAAAAGISEEVNAVSEGISNVASATRSTINTVTGKSEKSEDTASTVADLSYLRTDEVDEYANAVIHKYLQENQVASKLVAESYGYSTDSIAHWCDSLRQTQLVGNTYVVVTNLRLRSMQAIQQEMAAMAKSAGSTFGVVGKTVAKTASAVSSAAVGDGYAVQAVSFLYKLRWDDDLASRLESTIITSNASLDDLVASGLCSLDYVGKEKATVNIRQSIVAGKSIEEPVKTAIEQAVDESILKLREIEKDL
jgi:hypothetical protein